MLKEARTMSDRDDASVHAGAVHRRDVAQLIRWLFIAAIVVVLVLVAMDNRDDVRVGYAVGDTTGPIWIVILASALAGIVMGWLVRHRPRHRE
jgi:uncharacterized integral membrane protein